MNNILISLKRFFKNKNTVTILGVVLILGIIYWGYTKQIQEATKEISIPVAKRTIQPKTLVTQDDIQEIKIPSIAVSENVIRYRAQITGKYTAINTVIPEGSMFYKNVLVNKEDLPDSAFVAVKKGEVVYNFPVNMETTYGNSMVPGNKIDIYMKAVDDDKKIMVGKLLENVEILAVKDSQGRNVFEDSSENRTPAYLIFGVKEEIHILLRKASYMTGNGVVLFPVPHGASISTDGETQVSTQYLKDYINSHTVVIEQTDSNVTNPETDTEENIDEETNVEE